MKKLTFLIVLVASAVIIQSANAQLFVSGNVGVRLQTNDNINNSNFSLRPQVGTFLSDNMAIGGLLSISYGKTKIKSNDPVTSSTTRNFGIGGFGRYYLGENSDKFRFFVQGTGMLGFNKDVDYTDNETTSSTLDLFLTPSVEMKITEKLALDISAGNAGLDFQFQDAGNQMGLSLNLNSINFGLTYTLQ